MLPDDLAGDDADFLLDDDESPNGGAGNMEGSVAKVFNRYFFDSMAWDVRPVMERIEEMLKVRKVGDAPQRQREYERRRRARSAAGMSVAASHKEEVAR